MPSQKSPKVLCIGAGNMGSAIITAAINAGIFDPKRTFITDPNSEKIRSLQESLGVQSGNPGDCSVIFLAVKPQSINDVFPVLCETNTLLISVLAGISCSKIQDISGINSVCRVMPNTPALVGEGASGMFFSKNISPEEKQFCYDIFRACGQVIDLPNEEDMHAITALSGSGPAYFFQFVEHMIQAGKKMGLTPDISQTLACQTFFGAAKLLKQSDESPEKLRKKVTSKGGTTQAALEQLEADGFQEIVFSALSAAQKRSTEL